MIWKAIWNNLVPFIAGAGFVHQLLVMEDRADALILLGLLVAWVFFDWLDMKAEERGK